MSVLSPYVSLPPPIPSTTTSVGFAPPSVATPGGFATTGYDSISFVWLALLILVVGAIILIGRGPRPRV